MPAWGPVARRELIRGLRALGFDGPFSGGRHQFMARGDLEADLLAYRPFPLRHGLRRHRGWPRLGLHADGGHLFLGDDLATNGHRFDDVIKIAGVLNYGF